MATESLCNLTKSVLDFKVYMIRKVISTTLVKIKIVKTFDAGG